MSRPDPSRRDFVKRMPYVAPAVLTLAAAPEYAKAGSVKSPGRGSDKGDKSSNGKAKGKNK